MAIRDRPILQRRPGRTHVERLMGMVGRDCLDHILILAIGILRRVLTSYSVYYNDTRTHFGEASPLG
jgi:hypothetical protein